MKNNFALPLRPLRLTGVTTKVKRKCYDKVCESSAKHLKIDLGRLIATGRTYGTVSKDKHAATNLLSLTGERFASVSAIQALWKTSLMTRTENVSERRLVGSKNSTSK